MSQLIEVIYEDDVLKPITPIKGLRKKQKALIIICPHADKPGLDSLIGTLSPVEAEEMQNQIEKEFKKIEGDW